MKRISILLSVILLISILISSCSNTKTYAELLNSEKVLIAEYIKNQHINVLNKFPADDSWGANDYVLTSSGLYFHLEKPGIGTDTLELSNTVVPRYLQYTLTEVSDTISNWSTTDFPYPSDFVYGDYTQSCVAFQEAASHMKKNESEAKIIVPSKIGFNNNMLSVTPFGYYLKIKIRK